MAKESENHAKSSKQGNSSDSLLKVAIIVAGVIFAIILPVNVYLYDHIPAIWKVAIIAFIILLPLAFFLQAYLHVKNVQVELGAKIQSQLREALLMYHNDINIDYIQLASKQVELDDKNKKLEALKQKFNDTQQKVSRLQERIDTRSERFISAGALAYSQSVAERSSLEMEIGQEKKKLEVELEGLSIERSKLEYDISRDKGWVNIVTSKIEKKKLREYDSPEQPSELFIGEAYDILNNRAEILKTYAPTDIFGIYKQAMSDFIDKITRLGYPYSKSGERKVSDEDDKKNPPEKLQKEFQDLLQFELGASTLKDILDDEMKQNSLGFDSYLLPLTFFLFTFFAGWLIVIPLINSIFTTHAQSTLIPLFSTGKGIPLIIIQWGFLGGIVYTSINLLNRFLRRDLVPSVYFTASVKLLLAAVAAIVIYFFYMFGYQQNNAIATDELPTWLLLVVFVAGIAPLQILVYVANIVLARMPGLAAKKENTGDKSVIEISGISYSTMFRLNEEGIDSVSDLALCVPLDISTRTRFPYEDIRYWKDQAVLYVLTAGIKIKNGSQESRSLHDILGQKYGIQTWLAFYDFIMRITFGLSEGQSADSSSRESFFKNLGVTDTQDNSYWDSLFINLVKQGMTYMETYHLEAETPVKRQI